MPRPGPRPLHYLGLALTLAATLAACPNTPAAPAIRDAPEPTDAAWNFRTDILPVLTKAGCNAGACHGAATGQGGFQLSLLGYDPHEDFLRITREHAGRRIDRTAPAESLLLRKASHQLDHEGGRKLPTRSDNYATVLRWIADGAPQGSPDLLVASLQVSPPEILTTTESPSNLPLRVTATLSDGSSRDVSHLALYTSNDDAIALVTPDGNVQPRSPGITSIMIRYGGQVAATRIAIPYGPPRTSPTPTPANLVDAHIIAELARLGLQPAPDSSDLTFLRRVTLDLAGRLPTPEEIIDFTSPPTPGDPLRRQRVIDRLLQSDDFTDYWTLQFADVLLVGARGSSETSAKRYHAWLRERIAANTPVDRIVHDLLTASGDTRTHGPANFLTLANDPRDLSEHAGRMFLGTRIGCARCHAHPTDRWTQEDYHHFAAYFAQVRRDGEVIRVRTTGTVDHPKTGLPVPPKPLGAPRPTPVANPGPEATAPDQDGDTLRTELASWLTSPDNPLFARSLVNRVWKHCFGLGLVEPVDDLRPTNPASHPALLDALAQTFASHGFNLRELLRLLTSSSTYQRSSATPAGAPAEHRLFSRFYLRELPAQVFLDAVVQATGVPHPFEGYPAHTRAIQLVAPSTPAPSLDILGRCSRERPCESSATGGRGFARALHLINGPLVHDRLAGGVIDARLEAGDSPDHIAEQLFLRTLGRQPNPDEQSQIGAWLKDAINPRETLQDLLWALVNSREFAFNH